MEAEGKKKGREAGRQEGRQGGRTRFFFFFHEFILNCQYGNG